MKKILSALILWGLILHPSFSSEVITTTNKFNVKKWSFHEATIQRDKKICTRIPRELISNWESFAKNNIQDFNIYKPKKELLHNSYYSPDGKSYLRYKAQLTSNLSKRKWWLIHKSGIAKGKPVYIKGMIGYFFNSTKQTFGKPDFHPGEVCLEVDDENIIPSFAALIEDGDSLELISSKLDKYNLKYKSNEGDFVIETHSSNLSPVSSYMFKDNHSQKFIVILWPYDHGCMSTTQLFKIENGTGKQIASTGGSCE